MDNLNQIKLIQECGKRARAIADTVNLATTAEGLSDALQRAGFTAVQYNSANPTRPRLFQYWVRVSGHNRFVDEIDTISGVARVRDTNHTFTDAVALVAYGARPILAKSFSA